MRSATKRMLAVAASVATTAALIVANGNAASAAAESIPYTPKVSFSMSNDAGVETLPTSLHAGYVTLVGSTTEATYHALQCFRTKNGATVDEVVEALRMGVAGATPEESAEGHMMLLEKAVLVGGVVATARGPVSVTIPLENGKYTCFDVNDIFLGIEPRLHSINVWGTFRTSPLPQYWKTIDATMINDQPRFNTPTQFSAKGGTTFKAIVTADEIHEIVVRPTLPGITDEYIGQYYDAVRDGTTRPPAPWKLTSAGTAERAAGLQAMSPGRWAIVHFEWPAGPYALLCLVPSMDNGQPHTYIGMYKMVNLFA